MRLKTAYTRQNQDSKKKLTIGQILRSGAALDLPHPQNRKFDMKKRKHSKWSEGSRVTTLKMQKNERILKI